MYPNSTSPTDGDDLCRIDVTDAATDGVTLLVCLCGLAGNGAVFWLLRVHICRNSITSYITQLALADFSFLLSMAIQSLLYMIENITCSRFAFIQNLIMFIVTPLFIYNMGLYLLTAVCIEMCVSILCPLRYRCCHSRHLTIVVPVLLWALCFTMAATVISMCTLHGHKNCRVSFISIYVLSLVFAPVLLISSTILSFKVLCGSQQHQAKRLHIVTLLSVLFFFIFRFPLSVLEFWQQFSYATVPSPVVFLLSCINSTIKPFIYLLVGGCWRECSMGSLKVSLQRVFEEAEDNTACSNDVTMAPASRTLPSGSEGPQDMAESLLESPDS